MKNMVKSISVTPILRYMAVFAFMAVISITLLGNDAMASTAGTIEEGVDSISGETSGTSLERLIEIIINTILFLIGIVSVIMIIIGGFRYVVSGGDSSQTKAAKDTILYAVIGLIIAIVAYALVNFVLGVFIN